MQRSLVIFLSFMSTNAYLHFNCCGNFSSEFSWVETCAWKIKSFWHDEIIIIVNKTKIKLLNDARKLNLFRKNTFFFPITLRKLVCTIFNWIFLHIHASKKYLILDKVFLLLLLLCKIYAKISYSKQIHYIVWYNTNVCKK